MEEGGIADARPQSHQSQGHVNDIENRNEGLLMVAFNEPNDENNLQNWTIFRKFRTALLVLSTGEVGGWASANDSAIIPRVTKSFGVNSVAEFMAMGIYLISSRRS